MLFAVGIIGYACGSLLFLSLSVPTIVGAWAIIFGQEANQLSENPAVAATASIGISLLASSLARGVDHLSRTTRWDDPEAVPELPTWLSRAVDPSFIRTWLLGAAATFGAFALLIPFLAVRASEQHFFPDNEIRGFIEALTTWISFILLVVGSTMFSLAITMMLALIGADVLADMKKARRGRNAENELNGKPTAEIPSDEIGGSASLTYQAKH